LARITKTPAERKEELLCAASELFAVRGFNETTVSDIVKKVGVAQGTFYYYFKSKDDILFVGLAKELAGFMDSIIRIAENPALSPKEKLKLTFTILFQPVPSDEAPLTAIINSENSDLYRFHERWDELMFKRFKPVIASIIEEGVSRQEFHTNYPEEITEILYWGISHYIHLHSEHFGDPAYFSRKMKALEELMGKALGFESDGFSFIE